MGSIDRLRVGVFGAGAIGCTLGVRLSAAGCAVVLVGRSSLVEARDALRAVDLRGRVFAPGDDLSVTDDPGALRDVELCLCTVKSQDNASAAKALAAVLPKAALVVCFQNGLGNAGFLRDAGLDRPVVDGIVTFNVVREDRATFRQATSGPLLAGALNGDGAAALGRLAAAFARAGLPLGVRRDIAAVAAGKLLINLGNGLSAVTGLPTAAALRSHAFRLCHADCIREGLRVFAAAGMPVGAADKVPLSLVARVLRLPTSLFSLIARPLVTVDPEARSSTLQDLDRGRATEIDLLNGAIVALAERHHTTAPLNRWVVETVHRLEEAARPLPHLDPDAMREAFLGLLPASPPARFRIRSP